MRSEIPCIHACDWPAARGDFCKLKGYFCVTSDEDVSLSQDMCGWYEPKVIP